MDTCFVKQSLRGIVMITINYIIFVFETKEIEIKLNWENLEFKWIKIEELKNYETVPSLDKILFNLL